MHVAHLPFHVTITGMPQGLGANPIVVTIELLLAAYFIVVNGIDFALIAIAFWSMPRFLRVGAADALRRVALPFARPVSVLLPVHNEAAAVVDVVRSLLRLRYPVLEVVVINDGSTDETLALLVKAFELTPIFEAGYQAIRTKPVRGRYRSLKHPELRVVDKENGGKGDALNAGVNESRYPLLLTGDGDSVYVPDALEQMIQPFLEDPLTIACGAGLRVLNEAKLVDGVPVPEGMPRNLIVRFQILEYLRGALTSRFAWAPINGLMSISGACGLWTKEIVVGAGGFSSNTIWEDMEMTVRVHHYMLDRRQPYRIAFVPAAVCWTTVPETLRALQDQRIGWHRHISETMWHHRNLVFSRRGGVPGWVALPAIALMEWLSPVWLFSGITFLIVAGWLGILSIDAQLALLALVFSLTILKVASAFLLDEVSYRTRRLSEIWSLFMAAFVEQFGYRQLVAVYHLIGIAKFFARRPIRGRTSDIPSWRDPPYRPVISGS
jgi:cellulose synthase/poly-beta-1,6-N-acetylglucosamine synthase-like glycosyltransferase